MPKVEAQLAHYAPYYDKIESTATCFESFAFNPNDNATLGGI